MNNILQKEEKKKILTEYRLRLGVVGVFLVASLVFANLVLLAPSYLLAISKYNSVSNELVNIEKKQKQSAGHKDINSEIREINKKVDLFIRKEPSPGYSSQIVLNILKLKGGDVKIDGITYDASVGNGRIIVVGTALNRDSLARFIEILKKDQTFSKVELPISSYVKSTNIDFSVVLERSIK